MRNVAVLVLLVFVALGILLGDPRELNAEAALRRESELESARHEAVEARLQAAIDRVAVLEAELEAVHVVRFSVAVKHAHFQEATHKKSIIKMCAHFLVMYQSVEKLYLAVSLLFQRRDNANLPVRSNALVTSL